MTTWRFTTRRDLTRRSVLITASSLALAAVAALVTSTAHAGARENEIVALWMEPASVTDGYTKTETSALKKCHRKLLDGLREDLTGGEPNITKGDDREIAKRLKIDKDEFYKTWFVIADKKYQRAFNKPVRKGNYDEDSVILIDCDPRNKLVRALVHAPSGDVFRFRFHNIELDDKFIGSIGQVINYHSVVGFNP